MSNEENTYSKDFKVQVAREAIEQDKKNLDRLSDKFEVPVSSILRWAVELEKKGDDAFDSGPAGPDSDDAGTGTGTQEEVELEVSDEEIAASLNYGVMFDHLNIRRLVFWSILGIVLVVLFVIALREMYQYNRFTAQEAAAENTEYYQVNRQNREDTETLNSFGVVDMENGIYRIPIDSAINEMAEDQ